jgi:hypothetical protein
MRRGLPQLVAVACFGLAAWGIPGKAENRGILQPIAFNHGLHKEAGVECSDCHRYAETEHFAGRPVLEVCLECHEEALTDSREEAKIREYASQNAEIPWERLYQMPDHVFFTHRRHVAGAGIQCETCHGRIGETAKPPLKPLKTLTMGNCMDCHRKNKADNDCLACHN